MIPKKSNKIKKIESVTLAIAILHIFLIMNSIIAENYFISKDYGEKNQNPYEWKQSNIIKGLKLIAGFLAIKQIRIVSAEEISAETRCCSITNNMTSVKIIYSEEMIQCIYASRK